MLAASAALAAPASAGDAFSRPWCEIDAGRFRLVTDHDRDEAERMVAWLQLFRPAAERYLPGVPNDADLPLTIVVFERVRDFRRTLKAGPVVGFMQPSLNDNLLVVGPDPASRAPQEPLLHEYVHYLLRTRIGLNIPSWLDEGLAGLLASATIDDGALVVGDLPAADLRRAIRDSGLSLASVLKAEDFAGWPVARQRGFYAWSRALAHWLILGETRRGDQRDRRAALAAHLAGESPTLPEALGRSVASLERAVKRHLERRPATVRHPLARPQTSEAAHRCLAESEIVYRLGLAMMVHNPADAAERLRARLDDDPDNADLWMALSLAQESAGDAEAGRAAARRALDLAPKDPAAAVRLANSLAAGCILELSAPCRARWQEAVPLLRRSLRTDPRRHDAIFTLGLAYLYSGRPGDALNYLRIAHRRQPWAPHVNFYLGESYRLVGDARARRYLTRAREWSPTELWRRLAEAGLAMMEPSP